MVRLYTIEKCPFCIELKEIFKKENIEFIEIDVNKEENEDEFNRLHEISKSNDVPQVVVKTQILVPNVSFSSIKECADLTKKFLV